MNYIIILACVKVNHCFHQNPLPKPTPCFAPKNPQYTSIYVCTAYKNIYDQVQIRAIVWYSPHCRRLEVRMEGGVGTLTIFGARAIDNGDYSCEVVSALHGTQLSESSIMVNVTDGTYVPCI